MKTGLDNQTNILSGEVRSIVVIALVVAVLAAGVFGMMILQKTGPVADKTAPERAIPNVRIVNAEVVDKQLYVQTQGEVKASMSTQLSSQVMGRTTVVSPKLKAGGFFEKDEVMLEIERADYVSALARMESSLADAKLALQQEEARADQSMRDWAKLGKGTAPDLVARKPQIISAKARVTAAEAEVIKATRDLERTTVRAPYKCQVDQSYIDFGATIAVGMRIADVSSIDIREVRVPVPLDDWAYLNNEGLIGSHVDVVADLSGKQKTWIGRVSRSEGKVDRSAMVMYLVVEMITSETQTVAELPPPGLFVTASIKGREMKQIVEIPRTALNSNHTVFIVSEGKFLQVEEVKVERTMKDTALISKGLSKGDQIIVSAIETPVPGMEVEIKTADNQEE